jgi:hypothetical protein
MITFVGEWYYGGVCPQCGTYAAIAPDPKTGRGDGRHDFLGHGPFSSTCRFGHKNAFAARQIIRFQMTQDSKPPAQATSIPVDQLNASNDD